MPTLNRALPAHRPAAGRFGPGVKGNKELCMVEEKLDTRDVNYRQLLPWTEVFRGFQVAIDPKKLLLAAAGIAVMSFWWWLWAVIFGARPAPDLSSGKYEDFRSFQESRRQWNLLYEAAGPLPLKTDANDLAQSLEEYEPLKNEFDRIERELREGKTEAQIREEILAGKRPKMASRWLERRDKPYGKLRLWPWFEDRGPNPVLLLAGRAREAIAPGATASLPPEGGQVVAWFLTEQVPVLIEPLVKLLRPVGYLFHPDAGLLEHVYFLIVILGTIATWAFFGGAITRMAVVQLARKEKIGLGEAIRFTVAHYRSYLFASVAPFIGLAALLLLLMLFGVFHLIPVVADIWDGLLWPVVLVLGLAMAVIMVGLVGWPLIHVTISAEGSDSFDALSRSYSYVYQKPWHYLWYCLVSLVYGAAVVFFVSFMGSLMVYLGRFGLSQTPGTQFFNRDPAYLFVWAPSSYQWRELLLKGTGSPVVDSTGLVSSEALVRYTSELHWWNWVGVFLVTFWLFLFFLMIVGFGYSYFWSSSTIIYLLMRRKVDDTEMDEVYLEEEEPEDAYTVPAPPSSSSPPAASPSASPGLTMVESPTLRSSTPVASTPVAPTAPAQVTPPEGGDGNAPAGG
jgi:hypothetical protein